MILQLTSFPLAVADPFVIPIVIFSIGGVVALAAILTSYFRQRDWHQVLSRAVEKGYPVADLNKADPDALTRDVTRCRGVRTWRSDFRRGLIFIAIGLGLHFGFQEWSKELGHRSFSFEAVPALIGIALLINAAITAAFPPKANAPLPTDSKR